MGHLLPGWRLKPLAAAIVAAGAFGSGDDRAASLVVATLAGGITLAVLSGLLAWLGWRRQRRR